MVFQWFSMVANHWSDDGMVTIHRSGLFIKAEREIVSMGEEVKKFYLAKVAKLPEEEIVFYEHDLLHLKQPGILGCFEKADIWITGRGLVLEG